MCVLFLEGGRGKARWGLEVGGSRENMCVCECVECECVCLCVCRGRGVCVVGGGEIRVRDLNLWYLQGGCLTER